ncbi:MAG: BMP family ABC transporter substrate-binding protein [Deltaproteobacteria bacterium]|nr:BMP family ABC transporter substrate-binding protein [Deltaproteobacteria bacterium]
MKKILLASLLLLASLVAVPETPAQSPKPLTVTLIFDIGGRGDGGFNDAAYRGLEKAVSELGVKAVYVEHKRNLELAKAVQDAAASSAGMVIGVGFAFSEAFNALAAKYPDKKFVCIDYSVKDDGKGRRMAPPANLAGITFREEEGSYLVGALAALTTKTGKIGFVGGMDNPLIRKFQAGYQAGAEAVRPGVRVFSRYAGITGHAFNDPAQGYRLALRLYQDGADIIYHASGATGAGVFRAARELNRLAIGVDVDQSPQAPGFILTSMTKNIDVAVLESVRALVQGSFTGGLKTLGLKENGVGLVYNDQNRKMIPGGIYEKVLALRAKIMTGEISVPKTTAHKTLLGRNDLQVILERVHQEIGAVLQKVDADLRQSARDLSGRDLEGREARAVLKKLYAANPYIIDCETVNSKGIMVAVEPPAHRASEGADISGQAHMVKLFTTHRPVLSGSFRSVEGPQAVVIHHPVFSAGRRFGGSVAALFAPEYLLAGVVGPIQSQLPIEIFLMQTDGLLIYDEDAKQIGRNAFTDPLYQPFPAVTALARKMAAAPDGKDSYDFYRKVGEAPIAKVIYWRTLTLHGTEWRLAITCAKDSLEN